jgi:hypothetical protein
VEPSSRASAGKTIVIPVPAGRTLPALPPSDIESGSALAALPGATMIERANIVPGRDPSVYAYIKANVHRNLFRIPL